MIVWRLVQECAWLNLSEGSCINEQRFSELYFTDKTLFEPVSEQEQCAMKKYDDVVYCDRMGIEFMLFYTDNEYQSFLKKI